MRWLPLGVLLIGCAPTFEDAPCYGPDECPTGAICVERHCLALDRDAEIDAHIAPVDGVEATAPVTLDAAFRPYSVAFGPDTRWVFGRTGDNNSARPQLWRLPTAAPPEAVAIPLPPGARGFDLRAVALEADGGLLIGGARMDNGIPHVSVGRLTDAYTLDPSFGLGGWAQIEVLDRLRSSSEVLALYRLGSGRVLVGLQTHVPLPGGVSWGSGALWLSSTGQLDTRLADGGLWTDAELRLAGSGQRFALDPDARLWFTGRCGETTRSCVSRLTTDGVMDEAFGVQGVSRVEHAALGVLAVADTSLALQGAHTATVSSSTTATGLATVLTLRDPDGVRLSHHLLPEGAEAEAITAVAITPHCGGWLLASLIRTAAGPAQVHVRRHTLDGRADPRFTAAVLPLGVPLGQSVLRLHPSGQGLAAAGSDVDPMVLHGWQATCAAAQ
jgi:hypothetical protein